MRRLLFPLLLLALTAAACSPSDGVETSTVASSEGAATTSSEATAADTTTPGTGAEESFRTSPQQRELLELPLGSPLPTISRSFDIEVADFNGDAHDDILFTRHQNRKFSPDDPDGLWVWTPDGYKLFFLLPMMEDRHGCAAGDVNGDGLMDAYCQIGAFRHSRKGRTKTNELWIQTAPGVFEDQAAAWGVEDELGRGRWPAIFDFDNDGLLDLYVTNLGGREDGQRSENMLFRNAGGRFEEVATNLTGELGRTCVTAVDFDGDGWTDLVLCDPKGKLQIFRNEEGADFVDVADTMLNNDQSWTDVAFGDLNQDGLLDMALVGRKRAQIRINQGADAWFTKVKAQVDLSEVGWSVAIGDFHGEKGPDVYIVQKGKNCTDLTKSEQNGQDWLLVGPGWRELAVPGLKIGCGDEALALDDELVLLVNGVRRTRGSVEVIDLRQEDL